MKKFVLLAFGVVLIASLGVVIDAQSRIRVQRPESPIESKLIFAPGRIEGARPQIELRARLPGRIEEVLVREGQFVEEGEILLRLDDEQYRHEMTLAAAELALANAQLERLINGARSQELTEAAALYRAKRSELERAQLAWKRIEQLYESGAVSTQRADDQKSLVNSLTAETEAAKARLESLEAPARPEEVLMDQARVQAAAAHLELAKVQFERTKLRAPSRGQILKIHVEAGELTGPDSPRPALILADTTSFRVRAFVEEMDAPRVKVGMGASIAADGLPDQQLRGRVVKLSPRMGPKQLWTDQPTERYDTKTREVWIELEETAGLVMGLRVDVMIGLEIARLDPNESRTPEDARAGGTLPPIRQPLTQAACRPK